MATFWRKLPCFLTSTQNRPKTELGGSTQDHLKWGMGAYSNPGVILERVRYRRISAIITDLVTIVFAMFNAWLTFFSTQLSRACLTENEVSCGCLMVTYRPGTGNTSRLEINFFVEKSPIFGHGTDRETKSGSDNQSIVQKNIEI